MSWDWTLPDIWNFHEFPIVVWKYCWQAMSCTGFSSLSESLDSRSWVGHSHLWHLFGRAPQECAETIRNWQFWLRQERKKPYTDVTREMVFEHERQVSCNGGLAGTEWHTLVTRANVDKLFKGKGPRRNPTNPTETWQHRSSMKCSDLDFPLMELNGDFCTDLYEMDQHCDALRIVLPLWDTYGKLFNGPRTTDIMRNLIVRMWHMWHVIFTNCVSSRVIFTFATCEGGQVNLFAPSYMYHEPPGKMTRHWMRWLKMRTNKND